MFWQRLRVAEPIHRLHFAGPGQMTRLLLNLTENAVKYGRTGGRVNVRLEALSGRWRLTVRDDGVVYFFSMATSFTKAALGAEGIGKDVTMIVGNGYTKNHAEITLNVLRENPKLRKLFDEKYC